MEWSATIFLAFGVGVVIGAVIAGFLGRRSGGAARERVERLVREIDEAREELETQRAEVAKHFEETSDLFRDLTEQYTRLYAHLSEGAREFCTAEVPALGRGLGGPLLEASGDLHAAGGSGPGEQPSVDEARPRQADGDSSQAVA